MTPSFAPRLASLLVALAVAGPAAAQVVASQTAPPPRKVHLSAFTGWQLNGDISGFSGKLTIDDSQNFGAALALETSPGATVQLLWIYNDTTAHYSSYDFLYPSTQEFDLQQHYFQIGGTKGFRRDRVETSFGGTLGAALFAPGTVRTTGGATISAGDTWRFAATLGGGFSVYLSPKVALRFDARMLLPMYFNGGSVYVGTGGSGLAVSAGIPSVQGSFTGGITFVP